MTPTTANPPHPPIPTPPPSSTLSTPSHLPLQWAQSETSLYSAEETCRTVIQESMIEAVSCCINPPPPSSARRSVPYLAD